LSVSSISAACIWVHGFELQLKVLLLDPSSALWLLPFSHGHYDLGKAARLANADLTTKTVNHILSPSNLELGFRNLV
jgi:hypothetical protein